MVASKKRSSPQLSESSYVTLLKNMQYMASASKILSSSLNYRKTLSNIAAITVPDIADWCSVQMLEGKKIETVALTHKDPKKVKWAKEYSKKNPPDVNALSGVPHVLRTGKSEFYPIISEDMLIATAKNDDELNLVKSIGFSSAMIVPICADKKTLGTITFVGAESGKHFTKDDLLMAEEIAGRAGLAIQNARLYESAQKEIKERKKLEQQLVKANDDLEQRVNDRTLKLNTLNTELQRSNRELEDFAYVASHDLQEPLRKIQAFSNLLGEEYGNKVGEGRIYIDRMEHAAGRMRKLIDDLLAFSRVTTKAHSMSEVDLNETIKEILLDMEVSIKDLNATITVEKLPNVMADQFQMQQLFQNLIGNSLKFHKPSVSPVITISCKLSNIKDRYVTILVTDNGIGFDEKYSDKIFTVFQRLHGKDEYEGTGIGLAVVRKIVERHNGKITAKSTVGKGSTFSIELPLTQKEVSKNG